MGPVTRQDVQNIIEMSRNRIFERVATKQDITTLADTIRQLTNLQQQSQQMLKQSEYQRLQLSRRAAAVEARLINVENELRSLRSTTERMVEQKQQPIIVPVAPAPQQTRELEPGMLRQYGYPA